MIRKLTLAMIVVMSLSTGLWAGSLNPPAPPTAGTMKPLNDVEPRIAIHQSDIPMTITNSGSYYLAQNVTASVTAITVSTNDVTIDLNGFTITGPVTGSYSGIYMSGRSNVEIRNGTVRYFSHGVFEENAAGKNHRIFGVRTLSNLINGIYLTGANHQVRDCTVSDTGASAADTSVFGIFIGFSSTAANNTINGVGSHATATSYICGIFASQGSVITANTVYNNGFSAVGSVNGIETNDGCTVTGNVVHNNGTLATAGTVYGIKTGSGCTVSGNTAYSNGTSAAGTTAGGMFTSLGSTVSGNTVYSNGNASTSNYVVGISTSIASTVTGNTVYSNGVSATHVVYGLSLGGYNLVTHNTAYGNAGTSGGTNMSVGGGSVIVTGTNVAP